MLYKRIARIDVARGYKYSPRLNACVCVQPGQDVDLDPRNEREETKTISWILIPPSDLAVSRAVCSWNGLAKSSPPRGVIMAMPLLNSPPVR